MMDHHRRHALCPYQRKGFPKDFPYLYPVILEHFPCLYRIEGFGLDFDFLPPALPLGLVWPFGCPPEPDGVRFPLPWDPPGPPVFLFPPEGSDYLFPPYHMHLSVIPV